jgi:hypothetical protein
MMLSFGNSGRFGDWMGALQMDADHLDRPAKVYWLMYEDSLRGGYVNDAANFHKAATKLWPEVVNWTGREKKY